MDYYSLAKALHIIAFTSWMAGMLYLPRLFVYHANVVKGSPESEIFKVMERRLLRAIMNPAMILTWALGIYMVVQSGYGGPDNPAPWLHVKLLLVLIMSGLHGFFAGCMKKFAVDANTRSHRFYRIINEVVTIVFIAIVLLVVLKPL
jgi:protoporphyrinogen IX oxidase